MSNYRQLDIYHRAQNQLRDIAVITAQVRFGDLANQLRRSGISVVSNIVEGAGRGSDAEFVRFLAIARASNDEAAAQIEILAAITCTDQHERIAANQILGRKITRMMAALRGGG
jgi:four helix bundle protein